MNGHPPLAATAMPGGRGVLRLLPCDAGWAHASGHLLGRSLRLAWPGSPAFDLSFNPAVAREAVLALRARWGGHDFDIHLVDLPGPDDLTDAMATDVPHEVLAAMLLLCARPFTAALERASGSRVQRLELLDAGKARSPLPPQASLSVTVTVPNDAGGSGVVTAVVRSTSEGGWRFLVDRCMPALRRNRPPLDVQGLLRVFALSRPLTLADLRALEAGDIVLLRGSVADPLRVTGVAAFGGGWIRGLQFEHALNKLSVLGAGRRSPRNLPLSEDAMDIDELEFPDGAASPAASQGPFSDAEGRLGSTVLDGLRLNVHVELVRLSLPLSTLQTLCEGQVLDTGQPLDADKVLLWSGGQCIGTGQLLAVGDAVGVRVLALNRAGQGAPSPASALQEAPMAEPDGERAAPAPVSDAQRNIDEVPGAAGAAGAMQSAGHAPEAADADGAQPR